MMIQQVTTQLLPNHIHKLSLRILCYQGTRLCSRHVTKSFLPNSNALKICRLNDKVTNLKDFVFQKLFLFRLHSVSSCGSAGQSCFNLSTNQHPMCQTLQAEVKRPNHECNEAQVQPVCKLHSSSTRRPNPVIPVFLRAENHLGRTAIVDDNGRHKYEDILHYSSVLSKAIQADLNESVSVVKDEQPRIAFLCDNDMSYVVVQWAAWIAGCVAVPLCKSHPLSQLEYFIEDSQANLIIGSMNFENQVTKLSDKFQIPKIILGTSQYSGRSDADEENDWLKTNVIVKKSRRAREKNRFDDLVATNQYKKMPAMIVYTSGSTGRPKGVVLTHGNLRNQMEGMIQSWGRTRNDVILHVLPLHHIHGIVNVLMTPLYCGAVCVLLPKFDAQTVWSKLLNPDTSNGNQRINVFMAVPTVYAKLIDDFNDRLSRGRSTKFMKRYVKSICSSRIRLMVSGSAALPQPIMERWFDITGHHLLERYGMTEIGMALTNPLNGPFVAGTVGQPFPGTDVCIVQNNVASPMGYDVIARGNSRSTTVMPGYEDESGELYVKGDSVFSQYWNKPEATKGTFTSDGWFKTGDTAAYVDGVYKIIGRTSVDIIKSGGYKISALEVERHLLDHPDIHEVVVVGLPDMTWGQQVAAVVVLKKGRELGIDDIRTWALNKMAQYESPSVLKCIDEIPRNVMGKVNKKELVETLFPQTQHKDNSRR